MSDVAGVSVEEARELAAPRGMSGAARRKPATILARGEPQIWLMAMFVLVALALIGLLIGRIVWSGSQTFWPGDIELLTLRDGSKVMGTATQRSRTPEGGERTLYRVGNRDAGQEPFRWIVEADVASRERPADAVVLERREWGIWIGTPQKVVEKSEGGERVLAEGSAEATREIEARLAGATRDFARVESMTRRELGAINAEIEHNRLRERRGEIELARAASPNASRLSLPGWIGVIALTLAGAGALVMLWKPKFRGASPPWWATPARVGAWSVVLLGVLGVGLESPLSGPRMTPEKLAEIRADVAVRGERLSKTYEAKLEEINRVKAEMERTRVVVLDASGTHVAPTRQSAPDEPLMLAQVVRMVRPNELSWFGKLGVYLSRWGEYLFDEPREANTEGGVFPVIVGTVMLTILLSIAVVPLGVVAALYLREYARQGPIVSLIRIAVNNLAGVPSIVYGVFGLGLFCYTIGGFVDGGPKADAVSTRTTWWFLGAGLVVVLVLGAACSAMARPSVHGRAPARWAKPVAVLAWLAAMVLAIVMVATTPYFGGLFPEKLPSPTYGGRGILWAALTLALLTLPVVIVASEEAIAAVPRSAREGSYGCGASKWQTIRRIVLPPAAPGIMTGAILAMARGAGEVAPLMLVGAMKSAPELPIDGTAPFVHLERSFMHLGFHIYDLGFQSPDSEAARPLVWTTTLLLVTIVLVLNLSAIVTRARLRARAGGSPV